MTLGQRILERLNELEKSQVWLCAEVEGLEIGTLNALVRRKSRNSIFAPLIAAKLGVSLDWLITGQGQKDYEKISPGLSQQRKVAAASWPFSKFSQLQYETLSSHDHTLIENWIAERIAEVSPPTFDKKILPAAKVSGKR